MFDVLIIGGGVAGMSCALVLGSARNKPFASDKSIAIITHQKTASLQGAVYNNAYGIPAGTLGDDLLAQSIVQLRESYPHIVQIPNEKVLRVEGQALSFKVITNRNTYATKAIVIAIGAANTFSIEGLMKYVIPHQKSISAKNRIQLANHDHKVAEGIYVAGTLAGWSSQLPIAAGSGASVATDLLTLWNNGIPTHIHDSVK